MNKIIASVGLVALGAANVQAQTPLTGPTTKWWNVQATVRGFYDDNINTAPSHQSAAILNPIAKDSAWGYELNPKVGVNFGNDQTTFSADYQYSFLYYDHDQAGTGKRYDQDHTFNAAFSHSFSERYTLRVRDSFVVGQEPDALRYDAAFHTPFRVSGNNIVNFGGIVFTAELTPMLGLEVGYDNAWFDYSDSFKNNSKNVDPGTLAITPSLSGELDRIEQTPHLALQWHVQPETTASIGYRFQQINYTADEPIAGTFPDGVTAKSDIRDNRSHTVYLGVDHQFRPDFYGSVQAGGSYYDYYKLHETSFGPYARLSLTYVYMPESTLQVGFQEGRSATDVLGAADTKGDTVRDSEASVVFATLRHRIVPHLFGNLNGSYQHSAFQGGGSTFDNKTEDFYEFGANLEYQFNPFISVHAGYDFDHLDSDLGNRSYTRNKFYIGATASY